MDLGTVKRAQEIGRAGHARYIWAACQQCGARRWVNLYHHRNGLHQLCKACGELKRLGTISENCASKAHSWKGGRYVRNGYVSVYVAKDNPYFAMARANGYVLEHRLVMAQHLGRLLEPQEVVHHIDHDRSNNTLANLQLCANAKEHMAVHREAACAL